MIATRVRKKPQPERDRIKSQASRIISEAIAEGNAAKMTAALLHSAYEAFSQVHGADAAACKLAALVGRASRPVSDVRKAAEAVFGGRG